MKKNIIFTPILKTKTYAEPAAIESCLSIFSNKIIPFLEVKIIDNDGYKKSSSVLKNTVHFEQLLRKDDVDLNKCINYAVIKNEPNIIPTIHILIDDHLDIVRIRHLIEMCHFRKQRCAIRIQSGLNVDDCIYICNQLEENDFFIIDIEENKYSSTKPYINDIAKFQLKPKILIFSTDRYSNISNRMYQECGYNDTYNSSVVDSIKNETFEEDGFGTYCTAKNNLNETMNASKTNGIFILYNFEKNKIFSIRTATPEYTGIAYSNLKELIKSKPIYNTVKKHLAYTPLSNQMLDDFLQSSYKGTAAKYIGISITHYIEEINNNI